MVGDGCLGNDVDVVVFVDGGCLMMVDFDDDVMNDRILISRISENQYTQGLFNGESFYFIGLPPGPQDARDKYEGLGSQGSDSGFPDLKLGIIPTW